MYTDSTAEQVANLCHNIAYLRRRHGLTKKEMALTLGIGVRSLSLIEDGRLPRNLRLMQVLLAAHIFGVSVKRLFRCRLDAENCPEP